MSRYIDADELYVDWYDSFVADDGTVYDNLPLISKEQIDDAPSIDIVFCKDCKFWKKISSCMSKRSTGYCDEGKKERAVEEADRFPTDDMTWCWSDCVTDCPRQPKYIRDKTIPHSFANFSSQCTAYTPKEHDDDSYYKHD